MRRSGKIGVGKGGNQTQRSSPEKLARIRSMIEAGMSYPQIGRAEGVTGKAIFGIVKNNGLPRSSQKTGPKPKVEPTGSRAVHLCACGDHGFVGLTAGAVALVSPEDVPLVAGKFWNCHNGYAVRTAYCAGQKINEPMHRVILGHEASEHTDHANRDRADNRRGNIRPASAYENAVNKAHAGSVPFKGVAACGEPGRWRARIRWQKQSRTLGEFTSPEDAARAYDKAAAELHGEFACTNVMLGLLPP